MRIFLILFVTISLWLVSNAEKPNIVIIFTDDQGYADLGCYGSKTNKTPRLDQLAKEGTMFTSFYTQTVCGPSRSALLTGRYPCRSKGWGMPASEITFAELIKGAGYQTACIGKWDVSNRKPILERMPNAQGFDYFFGALGANDGGKVKFHHNNKEAGTTIFFSVYWFSYRLTVRPSVHPIHPSDLPSVRPSDRPTVCPTVRRTVRLSMRRTIRPSNHGTV